MGKAGLYGEFYTSGVFRVDDPDGRIFKFLNSHKNAYPRISTHYTERIDETYALHSQQRGIDIRKSPNCALPANKNTVLFFRLGDGTTIMKIESAGCPPFWQDGFRNTKSAMEFGRHSTDYFRSRFNGLTQGQLPRRDENCTADFIQIYADALDILYPNMKKLEKFHTADECQDEEGGKKKKLDKAAAKEQDKELTLKEKLFKFGVTHGLTVMIVLLEAHSKHEQQWEQLLAQDNLVAPDIAQNKLKIARYTASDSSDFDISKKHNPLLKSAAANPTRNTAEAEGLFKPRRQTVHDISSQHVDSPPHGEAPVDRDRAVTEGRTLSGEVLRASQVIRWSVDDVCTWVTKHNPSFDPMTFQQEHINGAALLCITPVELKDDLKLPLGVRKNIERDINQILNDARLPNGDPVTATEVEKWGVTEVVNWIKALHSTYDPSSFQDQYINGPALLELNQDELKNDLAVPFGVRKSILFQLVLLKNPPPEADKPGLRRLDLDDLVEQASHSLVFVDKRLNLKDLGEETTLDFGVDDDPFGSGGSNDVLAFKPKREVDSAPDEPKPEITTPTPPSRPSAALPSGRPVSAILPSPAPAEGYLVRVPSASPQQVQRRISAPVPVAMKKSSKDNTLRRVTMTDPEDLKAMKSSKGEKKKDSKDRDVPDKKKKDKKSSGQHDMFRAAAAHQQMKANKKVVKDDVQIEALARAGLLRGTQADTVLAQAKTRQEQKNDAQEKVKEEEAYEYISKAQERVIRLIDTEATGKECFNQILDHIEKLKELITIDKKRGYQGERRGWEVCLANPTFWPELKETLSGVQITLVSERSLNLKPQLAFTAENVTVQRS